MSITLTPRAEELIRQTVAEGRYGSDGEVIEEALLLLVERDQRVKQLCDAIAIADAQLERGESIPYSAERMSDIARRAREAIARGEKPKPDVVP